MQEKRSAPGEYERRPHWVDLFEIEKKINTTLERIDESGPAFLAKHDILEQLRKKYGWYEKWASSSAEDLISWAQAYQRYQATFLKSKDPRGLSFYIELAEKNHKTALDISGQGEIRNVLNRVENATIEDSAKELEEIKELIKTTDVKEVARKFLLWISNFRKEVLSKGLTEEDLTYFDEYEEAIESNIDNRDILSTLLFGYINKLAEIIRSKKKQSKK